MKKFLLVFFLFFYFGLNVYSENLHTKNIRVASRDFPESILLAEILSSAIEKYSDYEVDRKFNLGGVKICFSAIENNELDIYQDYSGSLINNILGRKSKDEYILDFLKTKIYLDYGLKLSDELGFNNNFVLVANKSWAEKHKLKNISDLALKLKNDPEFNPRVAFRADFIHRSDGYKSIKETYGIDFENLNVMEYNIAYANLKSNRLDLIDSFSTDPRLMDKDLVLISDDRSAFLKYDALYVYRSEILETYPELIKIFSKLESSLSDKTILDLNLQIASGKSYQEVANSFLDKIDLNSKPLKLSSRPIPKSLLKENIEMFTKAFYEHLLLSYGSFFLAAVFGIIIGVLISYDLKISKFVLALISSLQTIPSLALLALLIPVFGLGYKSALGALLVYALLPIIQNTFSGINSISSEYILLARSLALTEFQILKDIKLPMARNFILAGLKTSVVICIGTATLATFVGAGGLGDIIKAGIDLNSNYLIILGSAPAALLALFSSFVFSKLERV